MPLTDNEELARRWKEYGHLTCKCGQPARNVNYPGFCSSECHYDALSREIDKHPIGRGRPHGGAVSGE